MAFNLDSKKSLTVAALAAATFLAAPAFAIEGESPFRLGIGIDAGRASVESETPSELDKSGTQTGFRGFAEYQTRWMSLLLAGSNHRVTMTGEDPKRGVVQQMAVNAGAIQGGLFFNVGRRLSLGFSTRVHMGPAADFGVHPDGETQGYKDAGPTIRSKLMIFQGFDIGAEASWFHSLESHTRKVDMFLAGVTASIPVKLPNFGRVEFAAKAAPVGVSAGAATGSTSSPAGAVAQDSSTVDVADTFEPLHFKYASDELESGDERRVAAIIKTLRGTDLKGRRVQVSGYGSRQGTMRRTLGVSLMRAEKIAAMLVAGGLPRGSIDFAGYGSSVLDPEFDPAADKQRRVVVALTNPSDDAGSEVSFDISTTQMPKGVVYKVDELWTVLEIAKASRKFRDANQSIVIEVPENVTKRPVMYEKVRTAVSILKSQGVKSSRIATKAVARGGSIKISVMSGDKQYLAALDRARQRRGRLLVMPVETEKLGEFATRLKDNRGVWAYAEAKGDVRAELLASGLPKGAVINRSTSDLWSHAILGFGPLAGNHTLVVVHANRSLKRLTAALNGSAITAPPPVVEDKPVAEPVHKPKSKSKPKADPKKDPMPAPDAVAKPAEDPGIKKVVPQPVPLDGTPSQRPSFDAPDPLAH